MGAPVLGVVVRYVYATADATVNLSALVESVDVNGVATLTVFGMNMQGQAGMRRLTNVPEDEVTLKVGTWHQAEAEK